ncbi:MAG: hypothetical protein GY870_00515 [archaeon]|nr:hypothetical protein [archaeon]
MASTTIINELNNFLNPDWINVSTSNNRVKKDIPVEDRLSKAVSDLADTLKGLWK